ncbi:MAG: Arc family DNA-binding protein [Pseudomonadales bacterium]
MKRLICTHIGTNLAPEWNQVNPMPTLSIKSVPDAVVERLRQRAQLHHRSMQGELIRRLGEAARRYLDAH